MMSVKVLGVGGAGAGYSGGALVRVARSFERGWASVVSCGI